MYFKETLIIIHGFNLNVRNVIIYLLIKSDWFLLSKVKLFLIDWNSIRNNNHVLNTNIVHTVHKKHIKNVKIPC